MMSLRPASLAGLVPTPTAGACASAALVPAVGCADLVLLPRKNVSKPALVIELKYNQSADTAIDQILRKEYPAKVSEYTGDILLVGITYDKQTKQHSCQIERVSKCFSLD